MTVNVSATHSLPTGSLLLLFFCEDEPLIVANPATSIHIGFTPPPLKTKKG